MMQVDAGRVILETKSSPNVDSEGFDGVLDDCQRETSRVRKIALAKKYRVPDDLQAAVLLRLPMCRVSFPQYL